MNHSKINWRELGKANPQQGLEKTSHIAMVTKITKEMKKKSVPITTPMKRDNIASHGAPPIHNDKHNSKLDATGPLRTMKRYAVMVALLLDSVRRSSKANGPRTYSANCSLLPYHCKIAALQTQKHSTEHSTEHKVNKKNGKCDQNQTHALQRLHITNKNN